MANTFMYFPGLSPEEQARANTIGTEPQFNDLVFRNSDVAEGEQVSDIDPGFDQTPSSMQSYPSARSYDSPQGFIGLDGQRLGNAQRQRLNRQYSGLRSQVGQRAVNSGLYNTTVPMSERQAVERGRGQAMTALDGQLMAEQIGAYGSLTGDALAAEIAQRMQNTANRDALTSEAISNAMGLGLGKIGFIEDVEDIAEPVDYDLFFQLGRAGATGYPSAAGSTVASDDAKKKVDDLINDQNVGNYFPSGVGGSGGGTGGIGGGGTGGVSGGGSGGSTGGVSGGGISGGGISGGNGSGSTSGGGGGGGSNYVSGQDISNAVSQIDSNLGTNIGSIGKYTSSGAGLATRTADDLIGSNRNLSGLASKNSAIDSAIRNNSELQYDLEAGNLEFGKFGVMDPTDDYWVDADHTEEENRKYYASVGAFNRYNEQVQQEEEAEKERIREEFAHSSNTASDAQRANGDDDDHDFDHYYRMKTRGVVKSLGEYYEKFPKRDNRQPWEKRGMTKKEWVKHNQDHYDDD